MDEQGLRRVVSATDSDGAQVFTRDERLMPYHADGSHPESLLYPVWGLDSPTSLPSDGSRYEYGRPVAPPGGFRVEVLLVPPDAESAEYERPSLGSRMHQTPTVDVLYIVDGEIVIELGSGERRLLAAGDTYVSHGVNHRWRNESDRVCTMVGVLIGAGHQPGPEWMSV